MGLRDWLFHPIKNEIIEIKDSIERIAVSEADLNTALTRLQGSVGQLLEHVRNLVANHPELSDETASITALADSIDEAMEEQAPSEELPEEPVA